MAPAPPLVITRSDQAWRLIEKDYTLRLSLVAHKWAEEHQKAKNMLFAETRKRGNAAYLAPAWVDMEIADTDKRAEWSYKACCEVWEIQGRPKCRAFFRAVFDWCLTPLFATRRSCFQGELKLHQTRTGRSIPQGNSAILGHMAREMGRLRSEWNSKLVIATRDNEYQMQLTREREAQAMPAIAAPIPPGPTASKLIAKTKAKSLTTSQKRRRKVIFGAIQANLKGQEYCSELDERRLLLPLAWKEQGCPTNYKEAYQIATWKKRIQDEKYRVGKLYRQMPASEREKFIQ